MKPRLPETGPHTNLERNQMILVYDLRRDVHRRRELLSRVSDQWQAYLRGERHANIAEGRITELFYAPYEGEHMFRLGDGAQSTCWPLQGDDSWYVVCRAAKVEHVIFQIPSPIGKMQVVTRIWIGS